jgi:hypothetical protein
MPAGRPAHGKPRARAFTARVRREPSGLLPAPAGCLIRRRQAGTRPHGHCVRRFDQQPERVPLGRPGGCAIWADPIHGGEHLALLEHCRQLGAVPSASLDLEVHEPIERDRRRNLALDKRVDVADVTRHNRNEPERAAGVAPRQSSGHSEVAAVANPAPAEGRVLMPALCTNESLNHMSPLGGNADQFHHQCWGRCRFCHFEKVRNL